MDKQTETDRSSDNLSAHCVHQEKSNTRPKRLFKVLSLLALAAGIAARVYGAKLYALNDNMDYAIVVLMAQNIVAGIDFPVFFYGQAYMGSLEPFVSAVLGFVFGPTPFVVCLGTALVASLMLVAVWFVARRIGGYVASFVAVSLCAIGPFGYFHYMASPRGGYALCLLLTVLLIREGVFLGDVNTPSGRKESLGFFRTGLLVGLAFWNFWLVAPAVAAAGIMILSRLRLRVLRPSVLAPAVFGFMLGSSPWWIWNIRHSWESLDSAAGAEPTLHSSLETFKTLLNERLFQVVDFGVEGWVAAAAPGIVLFLIVLPVVALAFNFRARSSSPLRRLAAFVALYSVFLSVFYVFSEFGTFNTSRYLLPLLPLLAVWIGCGVGHLARMWRGGDSATCSPNWVSSSAGVGAVLGVLAAAVPLALGLISVEAHRSKNSNEKTIYDASRELMSLPSSSHAMFGEFKYFGVNWATDGKSCLVSPKLWRYHPFLVELENAVSPGVFANMDKFTHFLSSTATSAQIAHVGKYGYIYDAVAPQTLLTPIRADEIESVTEKKDREWTDELIDSNGDSYAALIPSGRDNECSLIVKFRRPTRTAGVRVFVRRDNTLVYSRVWGRSNDSEKWRELSPGSQQREWYWSGSRFYTYGVNRRTEILFKEEAEVTELRVELRPRTGRTGLYIETLQALSAGPARDSVDIESVAEALRGAGVERIFADRWYANELHRILGLDVWISREPDITGEDQWWVCTVPVVDSTAVIVLDGEAERARSVFADAGVEVAESSSGGMTIFRPVTGESRPESDSTLCFYGGQLMCNRPIDAGGGLIPGSSASFPELKVRLLGIFPIEYDNESATVSMLWETSGREDRGGDAMIFLHAIDANGKIAFQTDRRFARNTQSTPTAGVSRWLTMYVMTPLPDTSPGEYNLAVGLWRPGLLSNRFKVESEDGKIDDRRLILPIKIKVEDK